jgi:uncharacterized protein (UPF0332 family)
LSNKEKLSLLARYRLKQANESLEEAKYLFAGNKSLRSVMNRVYYSMYYAVLALLIFENYVSSKHIGIISFFNKQFIKQGIFPKEMGRWINKAFEMRQKSDYREYVELTHEQVEPFLEFSLIFIKSIEEYLDKTQLNNALIHAS